MTTIAWAVEFVPATGKPFRFHGPFMDSAAAREWAEGSLPPGTWDIGIGDVWQAASDVLAQQRRAA